MAQFAQIFGIDFDIYSHFICWGLIFIRTFVMVLLTPFLGTKAVPPRAKVALSILLSGFVGSLLIPDIVHDLPDDKGLLLALFLKEAFFGLVIGLVTTMTFYAIEAAGRIVDNQRGGANAQVFLPQLGQVSLFGLFLFWLAIALFIAVGGHRFFLEAFFLSFQAVPILQIPHIAEGFSPFLQYVVRLSGDVLVIAVQLSAPVLIAILLIDIVLGIANKMAPQINVFELGFAIKGYVAPLMIYVSLLILSMQMKEIMKAMVASIYKLSSLFGN